MTNTKASQCTTRRDIPSARRLLEARASALQPKDRPSGVVRTVPPDEAAAPESERDDEKEAKADPSSLR